MKNIVSYVPKIQYVTKSRVLALSVVANAILLVVAYMSLQQVYNFKCSEGGYFVKDTVCGEMADAAFYRTEYYRLSAMESNTDIYNQ